MSVTHFVGETMENLLPGNVYSNRQFLEKIALLKIGPTGSWGEGSNLSALMVDFLWRESRNLSTTTEFIVTPKGLTYTSLLIHSGCLLGHKFV